MDYKKKSAYLEQRCKELWEENEKLKFNQFLQTVNRDCNKEV